MNFAYYDLAGKKKSDRIEVLFPGFRAGAECVTVISPHDDDALLGAGYLIQAAREEGAEVRIVIVCDGRAGYSRLEDKAGIVARRKAETIQAYAVLGLAADRIHRLELPDFSALHYLGWQLPTGAAGMFQSLVPRFRKWRVTRLIIPNGHREHIDHTAAYLAALFFGPQTGDAVLADWGTAPAIQTTLIYSVWADFPPGEGPGLRADLAILAPVAAEEKVMAGLTQFASQSQVISGLVAARADRQKNGRALELYLRIDPRPRLAYEPYWEELKKI